jgi:hypothetical protein
MASTEQIADLRRKTSEPDATSYSDADLNKLIDDNAGDVNKVARIIWETKASMFAEMVDITEAGSSRKNSQLYSNALKMAAYYAGIDNDPDPLKPVAGVDYPSTSRIVRL